MEAYITLNGFLNFRSSEAATFKQKKKDFRSVAGGLFLVGAALSLTFARAVAGGLFLGAAVTTALRGLELRQTG